MCLDSPKNGKYAAAKTTARGARAAKTLTVLAICLAAVRLATTKEFNALNRHKLLRHLPVSHFANSSGRIAFCVPALYNVARIVLSVLSQWVGYHERLGVDEFFLHVMEAEQGAATGTGQFSEWLRHHPNVRMNIVEGKTKCEGWSSDCGQGSAITRCWRHVKRAKFSWVLFGDIDEFWALNSEGSSSGTTNLRAFLQPYTEFYGINFGKYEFVSNGECLSIDALPAGLVGFSTIMRRPWRRHSPRTTHSPSSRAPT